MNEDRYLPEQKGIIEDIHLPGKAIIRFILNGEPQRALLWIKCFKHQGKFLEHTDSFHGKLNVNDGIIFNCHIYDRESKDNCQWYAPCAYKAGPDALKNSNVCIVNQTGYVTELNPGKGVIIYESYDKEHRVLFMRSKFYYFGRRPGNKHQLQEFLSDGDPVQFDAESCDPTVENKNTTFFASLVWKGKKPVGGPSTWGAQNFQIYDDIPQEETMGTYEEIEDEFPALTPAPGLLEKHSYKVYELGGGPPREGKGNVVAILNEECGIALWMVKRNVWETVFVHRKNAFLSEVALGKYDLQESFTPGTQLDIRAVPAIPTFPCKWIAHKAVANIS